MKYNLKEVLKPTKQKLHKGWKFSQSYSSGS